MNRAVVFAAIAAALVVALTGCSPVAVPGPAHTTPPSRHSPTTPTETVPPTENQSWLDELAMLPVKDMLPLTNYVRTTDFGPAWADVDGLPCDTRDQILQRDLTDITLAGECKVTSGTLHDPYTGVVIHFVRGETTSAAVQIDHVVPLANAWVEGAQALTYSTREQFANDPIELLAVDGPTNEAKGDLDASQWLPPVVSFDCTYVEKQISVKVKYHLWVTQAEHDAIARVLASCGEGSIDSASPSASPPPTPTAESEAGTEPTSDPSVVAPAPPAPATGAKTVITPGAYCAVRGAQGVSKTGKTYTCGSKGPDKSGRLHWNS